MNPKTMTYQALTEQYLKSCNDLSYITTTGAINSMYVVHFREEAKKSVSRAVTTVITYSLASYILKRDPSENIEEVKAHYRPVCEDEVKGVLKSAFNPKQPSPEQKAIVEQCVDQYVADHTADQPYLDVIAAGITGIFLTMAGMQMWKKSICARKVKDLKAEALEVYRNGRACLEEIQLRALSSLDR